jgi:hypothetical protein
VRLKVKHIDTAQKIIRIEQSKGRKNRCVKLPDDKDYRLDGSARYKTMTLATDEFIRRFLIHVLPKFASHSPLRAACQSNCAANLARASTERCLGSAAIVRVV